MSWAAGEWRELAAVDLPSLHRTVHLVRPLGDGLWIFDGGYVREQESRLLTEDEIRDWVTVMTPTERGEVLLSAADLEPELLA